ncbi:MAG: hypothetical protein SO095_01315 [Candidatus Onthovivens sp.]|nr:hypothetical protein [Candidatus Onthovivens sp.]
MKYELNNGIRFTQKDKERAFNRFITKFKLGAAIICLWDDKFIDLKNGEYVGIREIPF